MKKLVAALFALAIPLSLVQAQTLPQATGTFSSNVGGRCVVKTNITPGAATTTSDLDGFTTGFSADGSYNFRSNTACTQTVSEGTFTQPSGAGATGDCQEASSPNLASAQTATNGAAANVKAVVTAGTATNGILLAGQYDLVCNATVAVTAPSAQ